MTTITGKVEIGPGRAPSQLTTGKSYVRVRVADMVTTAAGVLMLPVVGTPVELEADGSFSIVVDPVPTGFAHLFEFDIDNGRFKSAPLVKRVPSSGTHDLRDLDDMVPAPTSQYGLPGWYGEVLQAREDAEAAASSAVALQDVTIAGRVRTKGTDTRSAVDLVVTEISTPIAQAAAAAYLGSQPGVEAAAASGVAQALSTAQIKQIVYAHKAAATPDPFADFTTVRGTPTADASPAKQGTGSLRGGSVLRCALSIPSGARRTVEFYVRADAAPTGSGDSAIRIIAFFADVNNAGAVHYVAVNADGTIRVISGGNNTNNKATGPVIVGDNTFHHVAVVLYNTGTNRRIEGVYVDGVALDISLFSTSATGIVDTLFLGGLHTASQFDSLTSWHTDSIRISTGARYTGAFTPPSALAVDGTTVKLYTMDPQSAGGEIYWPARPIGVAAGLIEFQGPKDFLVTPGDIQTLDTLERLNVTSGSWVK